MVDQLQTAKHLLPREALLNANDRLHFHEKARLTAALREIGKFAFGRRLQPVEQRTRITTTFCFPAKDRAGRAAVNQRRDGANYQPTCKALIDGLVIARVLPDDRKEWVEDGGSHIGPPSPHPLQVEVWVVLEPVEPWQETIRRKPKPPAAESLCMESTKPADLGYRLHCTRKPHGTELRHRAVTSAGQREW